MSEIFSSDGAPSGTISSEGEVQAAQAPVRNDSQIRALAEIQSLRTEIAKAGGQATSQQRARLDQVWKHAHADGRAPADYAAIKPEDHRPADGLRDALEAEAQTLTQQQAERLLARAKVQGVAPEMAQVSLAACQSLGLDEVSTQTVLSRIAKHNSGEADFYIPTEAEAVEYQAEASRLYGGNERFRAASERVRAFLERKGVLAEWDRMGLTRSSLAFDPRVLNALAAAADRAGI
jgi:hypothetical protein